MEELHRLDGVAYVRFASVYRQFKDIQEFMDELKDLLGNKNKEEAKKSDQIPSTKSQTKPKSQ
jgi:transcriptional repressor NrdR